MKMNLCKVRYCYLKAVESSEYCYKHVNEEIAMTESPKPKCSFISATKQRCEENVTKEKELCERHAHVRRMLAKSQKDFSETVNYISSNEFSNYSIVPQEDSVQSIDVTKEDIAKARKTYVKRNDTTFARLAYESYLKEFGKECDKAFDEFIGSPEGRNLIKNARLQESGNDVLLRVMVEYERKKMERDGYWKDMIKRGEEKLEYLRKLAAEQEKMDMAKDDSAIVKNTVDFMCDLVACKIPPYDPRIPFDYKKKSCFKLSCSKCPRLAVFKGLCDYHSRDPAFDDEDKLGPSEVIDEDAGETNSLEQSKTSNQLFIHGKSSDKEVAKKSTPRNTYSNWSTRSQHGLIANLPSTSDLFIRTARNARYPLVNAYTPSYPTMSSSASSSAASSPKNNIRMANPTFSRTLQLGHPPNRNVRIEGQMYRAISSTDRPPQNVIQYRYNQTAYDPEFRPKMQRLHISAPPGQVIRHQQIVRQPTYRIVQQCATPIVRVVTTAPVPRNITPQTKPSSTKDHVTISKS